MHSPYTHTLTIIETNTLTILLISMNHDAKMLNIPFMLCYVKFVNIIREYFNILFLLSFCVIVHFSHWNLNGKYYSLLWNGRYGKREYNKCVYAKMVYRGFLSVIFVCISLCLSFSVQLYVLVLCMLSYTRYHTLVATKLKLLS